MVADGPPPRSRPSVGARTIRATLPGADGERARRPARCRQAERHGDAVELACTDADAALRALLARTPTVHDLEVRGAGLEEAFLELTAEPARRRRPADAMEARPMTHAPPRPTPASRSLRTVRNLRFFCFSLVFPLMLFFLVAGPNRHETLDGIPFPLYYMSGMVAWGTMAAVIAGGARIAAERAIGWNRQLRDHAAVGPGLPPGQGRHRLRDGARSASSLLYGAGLALGRAAAGRRAG